MLQPVRAPLSVQGLLSSMQINATQIWGEEVTGPFNPLWKASTEPTSSDEAFGPNPSRALEAAMSAGKNETPHLLSSTEGNRVLRAHSTASWKVAAQVLNVG